MEVSKKAMKLSVPRYRWDDIEPFRQESGTTAAKRVLHTNLPGEQLGLVR